MLDFDCFSRLTTLIEKSQRQKWWQELSHHMAITYKLRIIAYVIAVYFSASCLILIYSNYTNFPKLINIYLWPHNSSTSRIHSFSNINRERWLRLQKKFSGCDLNLLWHEQLQNSNIKTLTYRCDSFCGGLGDRLRGIISSYFLSLILNRKFMIYMHYPCKITDLFIPNMYNWSHRRLKNDSNRSKKVIRAIDNVDVLRELNGSSFFVEWATFDDIIIYTNLDLITVLFSNIMIRNNAIINTFLQEMRPEEANFQTLFSLLFEILFKPTEKVIDLIDPILDTVVSSNSSLLCLHVRIGKNPSNPKDQLLEDRSTIADDMIKFIKAHIMPEQQKLLVLVASDSNDSISKVQNHFSEKSIQVKGPIVHLDRPSSMKNVNDGCVTVVATFYILGECHISLLTNSGFSALANRRRVDPYANLYKYNFKQKRIERCENVALTSYWEPEHSAEFVLYCPVVENFTVREI